MDNFIAQVAVSSLDIACSDAMLWLYSEWFTVFPLAFLLLGLYALRVWDRFHGYNKEGC